LAIFVRAILISGDQASSRAIGNSVDHALEALRKFESGIEVISEIPLMHEVVIAVKQFSEKYDGSGYPSQLFGESITMIARIGALVTAYEEMSFPHYDEPLNEPKAAIEKIQNASGTEFDPMIVDIFCSLIEARTDKELHR